MLADSDGHVRLLTSNNFFYQLILNDVEIKHTYFLRLTMFIWQIWLIFHLQPHGFSIRIENLDLSVAESLQTFVWCVVDSCSRYTKIYTAVIHRTIRLLSICLYLINWGLMSRCCWWVNVIIVLGISSGYRCKIAWCDWQEWRALL